MSVAEENGDAAKEVAKEEEPTEEPVDAAKEDPAEEEGGEEDEEGKKEESAAEADLDKSSEPKPAVAQVAKAKRTGPPRPLRVLFFDLGSNNPDVVLDALDELLAMDLSNPKHKKKTKEAVAQGAAPMGPLQAMRNHGKENPAVTEGAFALLLALSAVERKDVIPAMKELDSTHLILELMKYHECNEQLNIHIHGLGLLCNLSDIENPSIKQAKIMSAEGCVDVVVADMKGFPKDKFIQRRGAKVLTNLALVSKDVKKEIKSKEGVSAIGACLESFPEGSPQYIEARKGMVVFLK